MKKAKGMDAIAPPPANAKPAISPLSQTHPEATIPVNVKISADRATYIRMLAARTRTTQKHLIESAIDLLRAQEGEV
jgi:hypothetical protein